MSGVDIAARGIGAAARARAAASPQLLLSASESGAIYGAAGAGHVAVARATIPARTIAGGAGLRLRVLMAKYPPNNAGWEWRAVLAQGGTVRPIAQNALGAALGGVETEQVVRFSHDRKFAFCYSLNSLNAAAINAAAALPATGATGNAVAAPGARARSVPAMVSQSAPPTAETLLIDFDAPVELRIELLVRNGDTAELLAASAELLPATAGGASARATAIWGDSLIEGSGATGEAGTGYPTDVPSLLRRLRPGTPITREGLGGQTAAQIAARMRASGAKAREWRAVIWAGTNDFTPAGGGAAWWSAIRPRIESMLALRRPADTIVCTLHPRASWTPGDASHAALLHVNAQIAAAWGSRVCDLHAALATEDGRVPAAWMADDVHLTGAGYAAVAAAIDAKMTALGWA